MLFGLVLVCAVLKWSFSYQQVVPLRLVKFIENLFLFHKMKSILMLPERQVPNRVVTNMIKKSLIMN